MGLLPPFVGALLFTVIQFFVLLFVLISIPIAQIEFKNSRVCYTFWGMKSDCRKAHYTEKGKIAFGNCRQRLNNMSGGAAFAIISVFTTLAALVFGILMLIRVSCAVVFPLIFTCISIFTILISWACVAGAYTIKMCGIKWSNYSFEYGPGFGLMVTAWCLQIANLLVLVLISFF